MLPGDFAGDETKVAPEESVPLNEIIELPLSFDRTAGGQNRSKTFPANTRCIRYKPKPPQQSQAVR